MKMYEVWEHYTENRCNKEIQVYRKLKSYPYKIQAIIYCWLKGYVYYGRGQYFLDPSIKIEEKEQ